MGDVGRAIGLEQQLAELFNAAPAVDADQALAARSFVLPTETLERGDARGAIDSAPHRLEGEFRIGGQAYSSASCVLSK